jgi:hypothetical protein
MPSMVGTGLDHPTTQHLLYGQITLCIIIEISELPRLMETPGGNHLTPSRIPAIYMPRIVSNTEQLPPGASSGTVQSAGIKVTSSQACNMHVTQYHHQKLFWSQSHHHITSVSLPNGPTYWPTDWQCVYHHTYTQPPRQEAVVTFIHARQTYYTRTRTCNVNQWHEWSSHNKQ